MTRFKFSKRGIVTEVRSTNGKLKKEVEVNGILYRRNPTFKTYNSVNDNTLLTKSKIEGRI